MLVVTRCPLVVDRMPRFRLRFVLRTDPSPSKDSIGTCCCEREVLARDPDRPRTRMEPYAKRKRPARTIFRDRDRVPSFAA